eukprot:CAMPEP_0175878080 /NCGR_PEP_ID=MMETSP0107_2-20121207/40972_1 /TAXON_ID=195067 ORGANISM="Goniomonas pacifica, Strain CCMP1869" /NCGR_SAMPLE_ID=MMETSP0107_2 /ASSEMBLY_ACC=CAM_ASM_000203 /LENGTH=39 /DNA_ID= /DNA_START= /DNA_END= /DNA_ORIENTATION=
MACISRSTLAIDATLPRLTILMAAISPVRSLIAAFTWPS